MSISYRMTEYVPLVGHELLITINLSFYISCLAAEFGPLVGSRALSQLLQYALCTRTCKVYPLNSADLRVWEDLWI